MTVDVFSKDFIAGFICAVVCVIAFPKQTMATIKTLILSVLAKLVPGSKAAVENDDTKTEDPKT